MLKKLALSSALLLALAACQKEEPAPVAAAPEPAAPAAPVRTDAEQFADSLNAAIAGEHRSEANKARDASRHPLQTLTFCQMAAGQTVLEITPGSGWYTEILAPLYKDSGKYVAALMDPTTATSDGAKEYYTKGNASFRTMLADKAALYGTPDVVEFTPAMANFGNEGTYDRVLTFRNVHNWVGADAVGAMFQGFFHALKPGGMLCVVEHRAKADATADIKEISKTGYMPESWVVEQATGAGFQLVGSSDINANPADTADHPNGVWTLPPNSRMTDIPEADHAKYQAIGESDRMTLLLIKPAAN